MARTKGSKNHNQEEIKAQILEKKQEGLSHEAIAQTLSVSKSTVDRYYGILLKEGKAVRKRTSPESKFNSVVSMLKEGLPGYTDDNYQSVVKEIYSKYKISLAR